MNILIEAVIRVYILGRQAVVERHPDLSAKEVNALTMRVMAELIKDELGPTE